MSEGGDVPAWAYEPVVLHRHDPGWAASARREADVLARVLGSWLAVGTRIEHVGSTAVPGLAAKPVIDLMAAVTGLEAAVSRVGEDLAAEGWVYVPPELDGRPWRRFFVKPDTDGCRRFAHLHLLSANEPRWHDQLAFRDALRADPETARDYERLKRRLAAGSGRDRESYTEAKAGFIRAVLEHRRR